MTKESQIIEHAGASFPAKIEVSQNQQLMNMMEAAIQTEGGLEKLDKLMALQERYEANEALKLFNIAMSKFQSLLPTIEKQGVVDFTSAKGRTNYQYAKIEDIAKAIRPALKETGLSYRFSQSQASQLITVTCIVTHEAGHSELSELTSNLDTSGGKDGLKSIASTLSYLRRYTMTGLLGIVVGGEDDENVDAKKDNETISDDQVTEIVFLLLEAKMSEADFCNHNKIKIDSIYDFPVARFEGAKSWLKSLNKGAKNENN